MSDEEHQMINKLRDMATFTIKLDYQDSLSFYNEIADLLEKVIKDRDECLNQHYC